MRAASPSGAPDRSGRVDGRRCVVTGAARGIGLAIARALADEGGRLGLLDVNPDVKAVASDLGPATTAAAVVDLGDPAATRSALQLLIAELGGVDVLVNNAGVFQRRPLLDITVEEWDRVQQVNARSMLVTTQIAARAMIDSRGERSRPAGTIINLASMAAKRPAPDEAHYAASKAAVIALTQATALELGPFGITANAVCPGYVLTDMGADTRTPEQVAEWSALSPLGRCADVDDVARVVSFLASPDAAYLTGQAVNVTGGMIMH